MGFFDWYPRTDFHELNLDWIIYQMKKVREYVETEIEEILSRVTDVETAFKLLKEYVDTYFDNLDVQQEINDKLDEMYDNGEFDAIFNNKFTLLRTINEKVYYQVWGRLHDYLQCGAQSMSIGVYNNTPYMLLSLQHLDDATRAELQLYNLSTNELIDNQTALVGHSNDSTYFDKENCFCIVSGGDNIIHKYNMVDHTISDMTVNISGLDSIHGIAYNVADDIFYLEAIINGQRCLASVDSDFNAIINYRQIFVNTELASSYIQGIGFDGNYIYFCYGQQKYGWQTGTEVLDFGQIDAYTKSFIYVDSVLCSITNELQAIDFYDGKAYMYYTNRYSIGLVFKGDVRKTKDTTSSQLYPVAFPMNNRNNIADVAYISNRENAGFRVDGSQSRPFADFSIPQQIYTPGNRVFYLVVYFMDDHDTNITIDGTQYSYIRFECTRAVTIPRIFIAKLNRFYINGNASSKYITVNYLNLEDINHVQIRFVNFDSAENGQNSALRLFFVNNTLINAHKCNKQYFIEGSGANFVDINSATADYELTGPMRVEGVYIARLSSSMDVMSKYFRSGPTDCVASVNITNNYRVTNIYFSGNIFMSADHPDNPTGTLGYIKSELIGYNLYLTFTERSFSSEVTPKVYKRNILYSDYVGTVSGDSGWYQVI